MNPRTASRRAARLSPIVIALGMLLTTTGCVVGQPRGEGTLHRRVEADTGRGYWLYLPRDMVRNPDERDSRAWPVVLTLHGMKPFDNAWSQACEWQAEADRYGFVVIAPELHSPDVLMEFPVRHVHPAFYADERVVLRILDDVQKDVQPGSDALLATGWSSGGYLAHYLLNRHPHRVTCLVAREANFSAGVLDSTRAPEAAHRPVLVVNTEHGIEVCKIESRYAIAWYQSHGGRSVAWLYLRGLAHERTPEIAAAFFAESSGLLQPAPGRTPPQPAPVLSRMAALDGNPSGMALLDRLKR